MGREGKVLLDGAEQSAARSDAIDIHGQPGMERIFILYFIKMCIILLFQNVHHRLLLAARDLSVEARGEALLQPGSRGASVRRRT